MNRDYKFNQNRYKDKVYRRCGKSGLLLPPVSIGLWHNFGFENDYENARSILHTAFDNGITHFDLANNYGPPYGSAESNFGKILKQDFLPYRDELILSTKAGYDMWEGPYGNWGSKKSLIASLDQSLQRMGLDYVDIFYHHRPDPNTPLEETMQTLHQIVRQGKALYIGLSNYNAKQTIKATHILKNLGTPCLVNQFRYNMLDTSMDSDGLLDILNNYGLGSIVFSPLAQGILSDKYLKDYPKDSRLIRDGRYLKENQIKKHLSKLAILNKIALQRKQTLSQMAIAWLLKDNRITSVLVGASKFQQLLENIKALDNLYFDEETLQKIQQVI